MRTLNVTLFSLALLAGSTIGVAAQDEAAGAERTDFIIVTGTSTASGGNSVTGVDTMSDPRVSGRIVLTNTYVTGGKDLTGANWGQYTLTNDDGAWEGEWIGFYESPGAHDQVMTGTENAMVWASGTGDYEGWTYVVNYTGHLLEVDARGLMYQGDIPPTVALGLLGADAE